MVKKFSGKIQNVRLKIQADTLLEKEEKEENPGSRLPELSMDRIPGAFVRKMKKK